MAKKITFMAKRNNMAVHSTYEVRWKNFKGFKDTDWVKIKPITILIGSNNSGKSSFIAPLLLMNQTLASRDSLTPLVVKGSLYDGGQMKEILHNYDINKDLFLGFRYHVHKAKSKLKEVGAYPPGAFEVIIGKSQEKKSRKFVVKKMIVYDIYLREYLSISKDEGSGNYEISGIDLTPKEKKDIQNIKPINFIFSPNTFLNAINQANMANRDRTDDIGDFSKGYQDLLSVIARNYSESRNITLDISYLGPLRETPHRYYEITDEIYSTVGLRGENTPNLLKANISKNQKELNKWVKDFGFGDELKLNILSSNDLLYSICFKDAKLNRETNISNTGFGASQILPLIVQAITSSKKESITIAEQPEIHLNPRLQGVLAELFVYMAKKDQRIICETHSEHLLMKLRTLVAEKRLTPDLIAIYYVQKQNGESTIKEIPIDSSGRINPYDWPDGFFDDTLRQSLALAAAQHKHLKK